uniref:Putative secreted protein n=1 Tax=Anopheles triannulatus TaxID=58253 RepID=A0A2M4B6X3_9DIPT
MALSCILVIITCILFTQLPWPHLANSTRRGCELRLHDALPSDRYIVASTSSIIRRVEKQGERQVDINGDDDDGVAEKME